jgi:hypothetical protein
VRSRGWLAPLLSLGLIGCGYVGPVLPPSPMLPQAVVDLTVTERGDEIIIQFTTPVRTTDNLTIREFDNVDLRVGPAPKPFDFDQWAASAKRYEVESPPAADPDNAISVEIRKTIPASEWAGRHIAVAVRTSTRKKDHYSAWSNRGLLEVIPELLPPALTAQSTAKGVLLAWPPQGDAIEYRIFRKSPSDPSPVMLGTTKEPQYLDTGSQYETPYGYTAVAFKENVESRLSPSVQITTTDKFPPSVPTGLTALAGPNSIEVSWQRSPEPDSKGYRAYRSVDSGPAQPVGGLLAVPTYSDRNVEHGKTYRYQVSAVDQHGNESDKSASVQVNY